MKTETDSVLFVMIDIQERFLNHILNLPEVVKKSSLLNHTAEILNIPLLVTEQYPQGLGETLNNIYIPSKHNKITKTRFSVFDEIITTYIESLGIDTIVFYGIETHVCVCQSVIEAIEHGYRPFVVEDAVSSSDLRSKIVGLNRIEKEGGIVLNSEMLIFELLKDAQNPSFKEISKLVKKYK
jgi:nicotinamidase-related amidase